MFDADKATRAVRFFERVLRHPKERYSPFKLLPWQKQSLRHVFGNVDEHGLRIIRTWYLEVGKKNGKSETAAGVGLYMLVGDDEPAAEVYGAATTKDQAGLVFKVAAAMVEASPELRRDLKVIWSTKTIVKRNDPMSFYRAISADGDAQDGINPHCVIVDELHRWKTARAFELLDVLRKGQIARKQPLTFEITTAGSTEDESPLAWRDHEYTVGCERGDFTDRTFFGQIFAAKPADDWMLEATWAKANPSMLINGVGFLKPEAIRKEAEEAKNQPSRLPSFKRYHLGLWLSSDEEWMPPEAWNACSAEPRSVVDRPCYLGLDLSSTTDLTSLVAVFPDRDGSYDVLPWFWMAKERVKERQAADRVPYATWVEQGMLNATEGDVIDYRDIFKHIKWCTEVFSVQELAFDPSHANQFAIEVDSELGVKCVPIPQRFTHLSEPSKKLMELVLQRRIRHGGHPVLKWNSRCLRMKTDDADNIRPAKPDRARSSKRIDGMVSLIEAISRAVFYSGGSIYEQRGLVVL